MPSLHRHGTDQKGVGIFQQVFCNAKRADVYTSALLADAMKPLNVLSKFENHFAIRTVRFQVQLEADGYFSAQKFSSLQPPQAGRVGTNLQFSNPILQIQLQNTCWASPKPDFLHWGQLPEGERTGKAGTHETFDRITRKCRKTKIAGCKSHPATRKWSCLLNNCHRTETGPSSSDCSTPTLDEWSAFATFLADVIEKYASVLEIDKAESLSNNENQQDAVDTTIAA